MQTSLILSAFEFAKFDSKLDLFSHFLTCEHNLYLFIYFARTIWLSLFFLSTSLAKVLYIRVCEISFIHYLGILSLLAFIFCFQVFFFFSSSFFFLDVSLNFILTSFSLLLVFVLQHAFLILWALISSFTSIFLQWCLSPYYHILALQQQSLSDIHPWGSYSGSHLGNIVIAGVHDTMILLPVFDFEVILAFVRAIK